MELEEIERRIKNLEAYYDTAHKYTAVLGAFIFLLSVASFMIFIGNVTKYTINTIILQLSLLTVIAVFYAFFRYSKISECDYAKYIATQYSIQAKKIKNSISDKFEEDTVTLCGFVEIDITSDEELLNIEYNKLSSNMFFPKE